MTHKEKILALVASWTLADVNVTLQGVRESEHAESWLVRKYLKEGTYVSNAPELLLNRFKRKVLKYATKLQGCKCTGNDSFKAIYEHQLEAASAELEAYMLKLQQAEATPEASEAASTQVGSGMHKLHAETVLSIQPENAQVNAVIDVIHTKQAEGTLLQEELLQAKCELAAAQANIRLVWGNAAATCMQDMQAQYRVLMSRMQYKQAKAALLLHNGNKELHVAYLREAEAYESRAVACLAYFIEA